MKRLARLTLLFAILFTLFIPGITFLSAQFPPYSLMKVQDVVDLFTPLVLIPVYWLLFEIDPSRRPNRAETLVFLVLAGLWVEGQGMHLAANSIDNLLQGKGPPDVVAAVKSLGDALAGSGVAALTYFYDEVLSHFIWHAAMMALAVLLIYRQWKNPFDDNSAALGFPIAAGVLYGLSHGLMVLEGETIPLGLPFSVLLVALILIWGRGQLRRQPILTFCFVAFGVSLLLFLVWWLAWGCWASPIEALHAVLRGARPLCP